MLSTALVSGWVLQTVNRQEECFALLTWAQFTEVTMVPLNSAEVSEMYLSIKVLSFSKTT